MSSVIDERVVQMSFDNDQFEKGVSQTINSLNKLDKTLVDTADGEYFAKMEERIQKVEQAFSKSGMVINGILIGIGQTINQYINKGLAALTSGIRSGMQEYETQMGATQTILANVKDEGKGINDVTAALDELNTYADKTIYNFTEMTRNIGMFTAAGANLDTSVATIKGLANAAALVGANATTAARAWYQVSQAMAAGSFKLMDWRSLEISNIAGEGFKSVLTEVARKDGLAVAKMIDNGTAIRDTLKDGWLTAERFSEAMQILTGEWEREDYLAHGYTQEQYEMLDALAQEAVNAAIKVKSFGQLMETTAEAIGSGWAVTFRTLIGDFEKAKTFFTRVSVTLNSVIDKIADYRNHFLDFIWNTDSGNGIGSVYDNFKETIDNILAIFSTFVGAMRAGFHNIFNWSEIRDNLGKFSKATNDITRQFVLNTYRDVTLAEENEQRAAEGLAKLEANEMNKPNTWDLDAVNDNINKLIRIFRGLFAGIDVVLRTIGDTIGWLIEQIPGIGDFYKNLKDGNLGLLSNLADIMDKVTMVRDMIVDLNLIPNILNLIKQSIINIIKTNPLLMGMINGLAYAEKVIKAFIAKLKEINISPFNILVGAIKMVGGTIAAIFYGISEAIGKIVSFFTGKTDFSFFEVIGKEIGIFIILLGELGKGTISVADVFDYYKQKVIKAFESIMRSPFVEGFIKFFTTAWNNIKTFWNNLINMLNDVGNNISGFYEEYFGDVNIKDLGLFGALATIGILLYKFIHNVEGWASIGTRIADVLGAISNKINSEALWNIAKAVGVLAASLFLLSLIPYDKLLDTASIVIAVVLTLFALVAMIKSTVDVISGLKDATKPFEKAVTIMAEGISRFIKKIGNAILLEAIGDALIKITLSIVGLALAFQFMPDSMEKALLTIGIVIAALVGLTIAFNALTKSIIDIKRFTDRSPMKILKNIAEAGMQFLKLAGLALILEGLSNAVLKIAAAIAILSLLDPAGLIRGLLAILAVVSILTIALIGINAASEIAKPSAILATVLVVVAFGAVVIALSAAAALIGLLPIDVLLKGFIAIAGLMIVFGVMVSAISYHADTFTARTFLSLAAMMGALTIGIAAIIGVCSLIQNETQLDAMTRALIGFGALFTVLLIVTGIFAKFNPDVGVMYSLATVIGVFALTVVAIAASLKMLDGVQLNVGVLITLGVIIGVIGLTIAAIGGLSMAIGALDEVSSAIALAAIYGFAASIAAWGLVVQAIGQAVLNISLAVLNFEEAIRQFYDMLIFLSTSGETFKSTLEGAANTLISSVPNLFALFTSVGVAIGTAITGLLLGLNAMISGIVLNACTMLLQIIIQISDWVNNNTDLILNALCKLWDAILNLAAIALIFAIEKALPVLLSVLLTLPVRLWGMVVSALANLLKNSGIPVLELIGETFGVAGEAALWLADTVTGAINTIITGLQALGIEIDSISGGSQEMTYAVSDAALSAADAVNKATASITENNTKFVDVNTAATQKLEENSKKYSEVKKAEAKSVGDAIGAEVGATDEGFAAMIGISDSGMGDITGLITNGFQLDLDNQDSFWTSFLNGEKYYGEQYNGVTVGYLLKNTDLLSQYYTTNSELAGDYYDKMAQYSLMMSTATDNSQRQAALDYKKKYVDPLDEALKDAGYSMKQRLNDGIDWEIKPQTKKKQEETFDSWTSMFTSIDDYMKNYKPSEVDTSMFTPDFGSSGTDTSKLQDELKDRNDIIGKADSEIQPKDLTPTIDLDSLKNEVNQANGIMTGSLLAAQNAAIGDYINTDSELNPFLKDRWQNVYNFTQNNYSPKALSRIDIYRQTQNQLRLSRGM